MTPEVMTFAAGCLDAIAFDGGRVLEIGSRDVNGSVRSLIGDVATSYLGVDIVPGPGVDAIRDYSKPGAVAGTFDLVVCTEVLEHVRHWQQMAHNLFVSVATGGHLLVTTVGPGFVRHGYPDDFWRFTPDILASAFGCLAVIACQAWSYEPHQRGTGVGFLGRRPPVLDAIPLP